MWEKQLEDYRKHQALLTEEAGKARSEITATNRIIQQLSSQAAGGPTITPLPAQTEAEDATEDNVDKEEENLRKQLQGILKNCASSLGLEVDFQKVVEVPDEELGHTEEGDKRPKRQRSLEPFPSPKS